MNVSHYTNGPNWLGGTYFFNPLWYSPRLVKPDRSFNYQKSHMRYHPISHRIGHTIRWWSEPWSQGRIRTYNEQPSLTDGFNTMSLYTPDLPVLPWQGCTLYGNRTRDFAVKGRRLNRLSNRANCGHCGNRTQTMWLQTTRPAVGIKPNLEREKGFEPSTASLEGWNSTNWATPAKVWQLWGVVTVFSWIGWSTLLTSRV